MCVGKEEKTKSKRSPFQVLYARENSRMALGVGLTKPRSFRLS